MRKRLNAKEWLERLTIEEMEWTASYLHTKKYVRTKAVTDKESYKQAKAIITKLLESPPEENLLKRCQAVVRQRRHRKNNKQGAYTFKLSEAEAEKLQRMADFKGKSRVEIIRLLINNGLDTTLAVTHQKDLNQKAVRTQRLKLKDTQSLAEKAKAIAEHSAYVLALTLSRLVLKGVKPTALSYEELQLAYAYFQLLQHDINNQYLEHKKQLNKQIHNLDRRIDRAPKTKLN